MTESRDTYDNGKYEDAGAIEAYASKPWVHEVCSKFVNLIQTVRPFSPKDFILDYGGGPGITLEKIFKSKAWLSSKEDGSLVDKTSSKPFDAILVDINPFMLKKARQVASTQYPKETVKFVLQNAFEQETKGYDTTIITPGFKDTLKLPPQHYDMFIISLVVEYLTFDQLYTLVLEMIENLNDGGVVAICEWAEHYAYSPDFESTIRHMRGVPKNMFLELATKLCERIENPDRILAEEKSAKKGVFPSQPNARLEVKLDSFLCEKADTQDCPSGDTINYLLIRKHKVLASRF